MNREIIFRGKSLSNNSWEIGFYFVSNGDHFIQWAVGNSPETWCKIDPETIGQFTGLTDKNGNKIFEGDIIAHENGKWSTEVIFKDSAWRVNPNGQSYELLSNRASVTFINGNVYETPESLEKGVENV